MAETVDTGLETRNSTGDQTTDQQVPGPPTSVLLPGQLQQQEAFMHIIRKMLSAVQKLEPGNFERLKHFLKEKLYAHLPEEKQPVLPDSPDELMKHAGQFWGPLNIGVVKLLAIHLSVSEIRHLVTDYEKALPAQLKNAMCDSEEPVAAPPGYEIVVIKMKASLKTSVMKALEMKDLLENMKSLKGSVILLAGLGDRESSIVFYFPVSTVFAFFQRLIHEKRYKAQLQRVGAQLVIVPNQASWDVGDGTVVYNSMDTIVDMQKVAKECPEFGILVIGETGDGKSTLINSLLGVNIAAVAATTHSETVTTAITAYKADIAGVPVAVYDTPGINAGEVTSNKEVLDCIKVLNKGKKIHLTIFCFPLREVRLKANHTETLKAYQAAGVDWTGAIIALTFADLVNAQMAPRDVCENPDFDVGTYFKERVQMWKTEITTKLVADVGIPQRKADSIIIAPVTDDQSECLPDGEDWFIPLWLDILDLLPPAAYVRFLQMYNGKISFTGETSTIHLVGADAKRFQEIAERKFSDLKKAGIAALGGVVAAGIAVGVGGVAALIGISGALSFGIAIPLVAVGVAATVGVGAAIGGGVHFMKKYFRRDRESD